MEFSIKAEMQLNSCRQTDCRQARDAPSGILRKKSRRIE